MSDTPGREPEQRLPVPRPPAEPAPVERFTSPPSARAVELTPGARRRRSSASRRTPAGSASWRSSWSILFIAIYWFYELAPARAHRSRASTPRPTAQQVTVGRARLQPVRGELRALPRRQRRGRDRPVAQPPGQAVRPPVGRLHQQHAGRRRPLRLRQPELADAGLVERGPPARAAQLRPDRGPDRVHPGAQRRRPTRSATHRSNEPDDRPDHGQGRDVQRLASTRTTSRHPARRRSRPAGRTRSRTPSGVAGASGAPAASVPTPNATARSKVTASGIAFTTPDVTAPADKAVRHRLRQPGRRHAAQHRDQGLDRRRQVHRAPPSPASRPSPTQVPALAAGTYPFHLHRPPDR